MCDFVCGTTCLSHAKMLLHWLVNHFQMKFELHFGCGSETAIPLCFEGKYITRTVNVFPSRYLLCGQTVTGDMAFTPVKEKTRPSFSTTPTMSGATVVAATPPTNNPVIMVSAVNMETRTAGSHAVQVYICIEEERCFVCFDSFCPSQHFFSHVVMDLPGLNQY